MKLIGYIIAVALCALGAWLVFSGDHVLGLCLALAALIIAVLAMAADNSE